MTAPREPGGRVDLEAIEARAKAAVYENDLAVEGMLKAGPDSDFAREYLPGHKSGYLWHYAQDVPALVAEVRALRVAILNWQSASKAVLQWVVTDTESRMEHNRLAEKEAAAYRSLIALAGDLHP